MKVGVTVEAHNVNVGYKQSFALVLILPHGASVDKRSDSDKRCLKVLQYTLASHVFNLFSHGYMLNDFVLIGTSLDVFQDVECFSS